MLRIAAHRTHLHKLVDACTAARLNDVQAHGHVGIEVTPRISAVRANAANLCRQVHDHVGALGSPKPMHRCLFREVVFGAAGNDQGLRAALPEHGTYAPAEESRAASDQDALASELSHSTRPERHSIDFSPASTNARSCRAS